MFEVLLTINTDNLTPKKINSILTAYEAHADYDLIFSYLHACRQVQQAKLEKTTNALDTAVENVVADITELLKNVTDDALASLKKEFLDGTGNVKSVAKIPHHAFRCAAMTVVSVFQITDGTKRKNALPYLGKVLASMNKTYNAFSTATDFNKTMHTAIQEWQGKVLQDTDNKVFAADEKVKTAISAADEKVKTVISAADEKVKTAIKEKDDLWAELQKMKEETMSTMSGQTSASTREQNGKMEVSSFRDTLAMRKFWRTSMLKLLELLKIQHTQLLNIERVSFRNGSVLLSSRIKGLIIALCKEEKTVNAALDAIDKYKEPIFADLKNLIARANLPDCAGKPGWFGDKDASDPLPGFELGEKADSKKIEEMKNKLTRIANMFADAAPADRLVPYDLETSKHFKGLIENLKSKTVVKPTNLV